MDTWSEINVSYYYYYYLLLIPTGRYLASGENRHALPLFTSLLNTVCSYDPVGLGLPYNHLLFHDTLEPLVEVTMSGTTQQLQHLRHLNIFVLN